MTAMMMMMMMMMMMTTTTTMTKVMMTMMPTSVSVSVHPDRYCVRAGVPVLLREHGPQDSDGSGHPAFRQARPSGQLPPLPGLQGFVGGRQAGHWRQGYCRSVDVCVLLLYTHGVRTLWYDARRATGVKAIAGQ